MSTNLHILYSYPDRLGLPGIGTTAWHQVAGLTQQGMRVTLYCGSCQRPVPGIHEMHETMRLAGCPIPYRLLGRDRALAWHDWRVAQALRWRHEDLNLVHCWPGAARKTLSKANDLGIVTALERPSSHTAQVYEVIEREFRRLGMPLEEHHYSFPNPRRLALQEQEYALARYLLCPSQSAARTFLDRGFRPAQLRLHQYGYDPTLFSVPDTETTRPSTRPLHALFVGEGFPLKGLHLALEAWFASGLADKGTFSICGRFMPAYREKLAHYLSHPSIRELGFQSDVAAIMRQCDVLVLPSFSEGSALVTYEARACGLVLLVSDAAGARCTHLHDGLIHPAGDIQALKEHFAMVGNDPALLARLRSAGLAGLSELTWSRAAQRLAAIYQKITTSAAAIPSHAAPAAAATGWHRWSSFRGSLAKKQFPNP